MKKDLTKIYLNYRNARSREIFNCDEKDLSMDQIQYLNEYIHDYENPVWKTIWIEGKPTIYLVSNTGLVKDSRTNKLLQLSTMYKGYIYVYLPVTHNTYFVHRFVAQAFVPNPENKPEVNHINGIKTCNWYKNLEWNTRQENIQHAVRTGLFYTGKGEDANSSIYTNAQIHKVCSLLEKKLLNTDIAKLTGVDPWTISKIKIKNCWTQISDLYNIPKAIQNAKGSDSASAIYSDQQIHQVCQLLTDGKKHKMTEIEKLTNVGYDMIYRIKVGKNWQCIASQYGIPPYEKKDSSKN